MKVLILVLSFVEFVLCISSNIPQILVPCYRNATMKALKYSPPNSVQLLVELIRKVELARGNSLDMRILSTSMLHSLKLDGIQKASGLQESENVLPYAANGMQFTKYQFLVDYLIPGNNNLFPYETLSTTELCLLHSMISSTVQAWERGDESSTCPEVRSLPSNLKYSANEPKLSTCPIEKGVAKSKWGTISPGHIIAGIAAALELQDVRFGELLKAINESQVNRTDPIPRTHFIGSGNISNTWAATVAGDLAEVAIYQAAFVSPLILGAKGNWDYKLLPNAYYLPQEIGKHWEMTSPEALGGIDGIICASKVQEWVNTVGTLRLSQVIDMYYSANGVTFDKNYRACQRKENLFRVLETSNLHEQTTGIAQLLQLLRSEVFLNETTIDFLSALATKTFVQDISAIVDQYSSCENKIPVGTTPLEIIVVVDGTWEEDEGHRLVSALTETTDVSHYGNKIGFINGNTGAFLTNVTNSVYQLFEDLSAPDKQWPTYLSLIDSLQTVTSYYQKKSFECNVTTATFGQVVIVISPTGTLSNQNTEQALALIETIKTLSPETRFLYVTGGINSDPFKLLINNHYVNDAVIESTNSIRKIVRDIAGELSETPRQLMQLYCNEGRLEFEDFVTPGEPANYEVHYIYLQRTTEITVRFEANDDGRTQICANVKESKENLICRIVSGLNSTQFRLKEEFCSRPEGCTIQLTATAEESAYKCTYTDCRYPNQVRLSITTVWSGSTKLAINTFLFLLSSLLVLTFS